MRAADGLAREPLSPQAGPERKGATALHRPHSLAGATVLQLVPALRDDPVGHAALDIALALSACGARAIVAGGDGPLAGELRELGGEYLPMANDHALGLHGTARAVAKLIASERIDIVHAHGAALTYAALAATRDQPVFTVTSFSDRPSLAERWFGHALSHGDRMIAPSHDVARTMVARYRLAPERIKVIPRAVDAAMFETVSAERVVSLRRAWGLMPQIRVVLVPPRIAPENGQMSAVEAAHRLIDSGDRNIAFVFLGDDHTQPRYLHSLMQAARACGIDALCRFPGPCADMPAALAAADVILVPALQPLSGRAAIEAQAMGRPVVASELGVLPECVLCPPRTDDELRTGWLVRPGDAHDIALAIGTVLKLEPAAYAALAARAREFASFAFSPQSVAEAIREVYTSLLARDA